MMWRDIQYALRLLSQTPGFTVLTTLVMACGIGLSTYLFSFMHSMLYIELPFADGDSLMRISRTVDGELSSGLTPHDMESVQSQLQGVAEFNRFQRMTMTISGRDGARQYFGYAVDPGFHGLTRIRPAMGRDFVVEDMRQGATDVTIIGHKLWQNLLAGRTDVIGQRLRIDGREHEIIGVMPEGYRFPDYGEVWLPLRADPKALSRGEGPPLYAAYHLQPGYDRAEINSQLNSIMARLESRYPKVNMGVGARTHTIQMSSGEGGQPVIYALHVAAVLILVLASINVGNLLLTRAVERSKETAIRVALGAPRHRLVSQMLWESIIICGSGALIGLMVLGWGLQVTRGLVGSFFIEGGPFWWDFGINSYTLSLFLGFLLFTIVVTGFLPAWRNSGGDFNSVLRDGTRGALGKTAGRLNKVLVVSEIFLSITILILAAVFMNSAWVSAHADYGGETDTWARARIDLPLANYGTSQQQSDFIEHLSSRLQNSAQTGAFAISSALPGDYSQTSGLEVKGMEYGQGDSQGLPRVNNVVQSVESLQGLNVELKQGRFLDASDKGENKDTVVVTESFLRHLPEGVSPLGQQIRLSGAEDSPGDWLTIVGVVEHLVLADTMHDPNARLASIIRPYSQAPRRSLIVAFDMKVPAQQSFKTLRTLLQDVDNEIAAYEMETYPQFMQRRMGPMSFISNVFLMFGLAALVLAASGIYGVMSNTINQRIQEIGVKRALGAWEGRITQEFLLSGAGQLLMGAIPGLIVGGGLGFAMSGVIGTEQTNVLAIAAVIALFLSVVVMLATWLPTRKALALEPATALHYE